MQTGYNVKRPKLHLLERLKTWLHMPARETGRKCLHGKGILLIAGLLLPLHIFLKED